MFTSSGATSAPENVAGTVYTATASDPDGNALTFSIAGGADAARFAITAAGALSFLAPPDFENPSDAGANNIYDVTLQVSDGQAVATLALAITVTNRVAAVRVRRVGAGLSQPLFLAGLIDGSGRVYVVERAGRILILNPATGLTEATAFADLTSQTTTLGERGLLGFALAPDFAASGLFYVFLTNLSGELEVRRYGTVAGNRDRFDPATADVILRVPHLGQNNHNGGWIGFDAQGRLYVATGDGGGAGDPSDNAQNLSSLLGKMLRLDVSGDDFPADANRDYRIPAGNPFAGGGGAPEIWALGLRNPFRASIDPVTGHLFIGDVGQGAIEEIDRMTPADGGANFGWRILEGTQPFNGVNPGGLTPPVAQYAHGLGPLEGRSVTGGVVYRGSVAALQGQYLFADYIAENVWSIPEAQLVPGQTQPASQFTRRNDEFAPDFGTLDGIAAFGVDAAGEVYLVDLDGDIFRIEEDE
jgi:glucose/arabinose dehydrogenase